MHGLDLCRENGEYHTRRLKQLLNSVVIAKGSQLTEQVCGLEFQVSIAFPVPIILQEHDVCRKIRNSLKTKGKNTTYCLAIQLQYSKVSSPIPQPLEKSPK